MGIKYRRLKVLVHVFTTVLLAVPALASEGPSSTPSKGECTMSAREVVGQFIDLFYEKKQVRQAFESWVHPNYIQHKPTLPDGRDAAINFLEELLERFPKRIFTIHRVIASDDLVAVHYHSQATPEDLGFAVVDIFRVEDCRMVEHWDVVQSIPEQSANDNTMF
ncbi:MAG: nuclear transport factor 2 family protein [Woeseiaceae bacterium]|nr:nuclear transport factor 2 family protein [Woeseiaceae bacterium]